MASKNSFQSSDGQSTKMGEKTQQVLRLIAALISSYLFCWETDIFGDGYFGDTDIGAVDDGLMQTLVPNLSPTSISAHNFDHMNFRKTQGIFKIFMN